MGRSRKPLEMQKGNITSINSVRKQEEEKSVTTESNQLKRPPDWLSDEVSKKEWRRITKELDKINLVGNLDKNNLGGYCNAFSSYAKATEELKNQPFCIERETRTGTIRTKNPLIDIQKTYAEEMRKFAGLCGLTIDSRLKAAAVRTDTVEENIQRKFGNI